MTTTAVADKPLGVGLVDHEREHVSNSHPYDHAPQEARQQSEVEVIGAVVGPRLHEITVLSILGATQLLWIAALGYGLLHLLK